jgi:hypothetical protein
LWQQVFAAGEAVRPAARQFPPIVVLYGLAIGASGLGKASSGALLVVCHALFFFLATVTGVFDTCWNS